MAVSCKTDSYVLAVITMLSAAAAWGQSGRAELFGVIADPARLPVAGAAVELAADGAAIASITTAADGAYHFFALPPGQYRIKVARPGFETLVREGLQVRVAARIPLDLQLKVGDVRQTIQVTADAPLLQSSTGAASFVVERKSAVALPLDGRNFVPLIALLPGVCCRPASCCRGSTAAVRA